jgi:hypothetical protein
LVGRRVPGGMNCPLRRVTDAVDVGRSALTALVDAGVVSESRLSLRERRGWVGVGVLKASS